MGKELFHLAFTSIEVGTGLHIEMFNVAFDPVAVGLFGTD